jgi:nucleoside-diphosphate-sugar epimerase
VARGERVLTTAPRARVLVTGASGFVGRHVCDLLRQSGFELTVALRPGTVSGNGEDRAAIVGDIDGATDWTDALAGCGGIVHLAGMAHVDYRAPGAVAACRRVNVDGTLNLARQAAQSGVQRLVFVSTVKVMGEGRSAPYGEEDEPQPVGPYAISKKDAEDGLRKIAAQTGLELVILRPPLVYGPGVKANFLNLVKAVAAGRPLPLAGLSNRRSLVFVGNLADAIRTCLQKPQAAGRTYFVSDGEDLSTGELVRALAAAAGRAPRLLWVPYGLLRAIATVSGRRGAIERLAASLTVDGDAIRDELGWQPPFTMAAGLERTVAWYRAVTANDGAVAGQG